jgi:hypothetical protein
MYFVRRTACQEWRASAERLPRVRPAAAILGLLSTSVLAAYWAYPMMFNLFAPYDDEGYMLISLRSFRAGKALYDGVFTQYGPFYYEFMGNLFRLFGLPTTNVSGRFVTLGLWVATSLLCGATILRYTRSVVLGVTGQLLTLYALRTLQPEPMHPGGLICFLLAALVFIGVVVYPRWPRAGLTLMGVVAAGLALTKVNIGVLAIVAVAFAAVVAFEPLSDRVTARRLVTVVFALTPLALTNAHWGVGWGQRYALLVSAAAVSVTVAVRPVRQREEQWMWLPLAAAVSGVVIVMGAMVGGTRLGSLVAGIVLRPSRLPKAYAVPLSLPIWAITLGVASLAVAGLMSRRARAESTGTQADPAGPLTLLASTAARAVIGVLLWLTAAKFLFRGEPGFVLVSLAWVAVVPPRWTRAHDEVAFVRLFIPALAVLQTMHAYPVAGMQLGFSSFLLILVGAICLKDAADSLAVWGEVVGAAGPLRLTSVLPLVIGALFVAWLFPEMNSNFRYHRQAYRGGEPLPFPNAMRIHLPADQVASYTWLVHEIETRCPSGFYGFPGLNSLYFWSGKEPPSDFNTARIDWTFLLTKQEQERVVDRLRPSKGFCLVRNQGKATGWSGGNPLDGPLAAFFSRGFEPVATRGDVEILVRAG